MLIPVVARFLRKKPWLAKAAIRNLDSRKPNLKVPAIKKMRKKKTPKIKTKGKIKDLEVDHPAKVRQVLEVRVDTIGKTRN